MGANDLSTADQAALQAMMAEVPTPAYGGDNRAMNDATWLANGARVMLSGFDAVQYNGQLGEVVGFDDEAHRYRVKLDNGKVVKAVRQKLSLVPDNRTPTPVPITVANGQLARQPAVGATTSTIVNIADEAQNPFDMAPDRATIENQLEAVRRNTSRLRVACDRRLQAGVQAEDLSAPFHVLILSSDAAEDIVEMYTQARGEDPQILNKLEEVIQLSLDTQELYYQCRNWQERARDEMWLFEHQRTRHGLLGMLKREIFDTAQDVRDLATDTGDVIRRSSSAVADRAPHLARSATEAVGAVGTNLRSTALNTAQATRMAVSNAADAASQNTIVAFMDKVRDNCYAALQILGWGMLLCFLLPYLLISPIAAWIGMAWLVCVCVSPPPRIVGRRRSRVGMLAIYPVFCVIGPHLLRATLQHPKLGPYAGEAVKHVGKAVYSIRLLPRYFQERLTGNSDPTGLHIPPGDVPESLPTAFISLTLRRQPAGGLLAVRQRSRPRPASRLRGRTPQSPAKEDF